MSPGGALSTRPIGIGEIHPQPRPIAAILDMRRDPERSVAKPRMIRPFPLPDQK